MIDINVKTIGAASLNLIKNFEKAEVTARFRAVNYAARRMRVEASKQIRQQVNLSAKYLNETLTVSRTATRAQPEAIIKARARPTRLATYSAVQLLAKPKYPERAKGDSLRGIPAGSKQGGVSVKVRKKGGRIKARRFFFVPLKSGKSGFQESGSGGKVMGVFRRIAPGKGWTGKLEHLYGPSVDQLFKRISKSKELIDRTKDDFEREYTRILRVNTASTED
jgi:hypothetical protein